MSTASKLVSDTLMGYDTKTILVNGKPYVIEPPTIYKIARAAGHLDKVEGGDSISEFLHLLQNIESASKALSVFIQGDEGLGEELSKGTLNEITEGLETAFNMLSIQDFQRLSTLARSVARMAANQRPSVTTRSLGR